MKKLIITFCCTLLAATVNAEHISQSFTLTIPDGIAADEEHMDLAASMVPPLQIGTSNAVIIVDGVSETNAVPLFATETSEEKVMRKLETVMQHAAQVFWKNVLREKLRLEQAAHDDSVVEGVVVEAE